MYSLDYDTMFQVLRQFCYSGIVSSHVPAHTTIGQSGYILLAFEDGAVTSCVILNVHGQNLYSDAEAYRLLPQLGVLEWEPVLPSAPQPSMPASPFPVVQSPDGSNHTLFQPLPVPQKQIHTWSTLDRSIRFLCHGMHTNEQIRVLLSRPRHIIEQLVHNLLKKDAVRQL
jgi:hypothetical protein